jgi:CheY-like chemotaxis protein
VSEVDLDLSGARVLVVDDQPKNLDVLCSALETAKYDVLIASSGAQGLSITRRTHPDIVLLDVRMPGIDGSETCRRHRG